MYRLLGISLALAAFFSINALASLLTAVLWRGLRRPARHWPPALESRVVFLLRFLPAVLALGCVLALLVPAYTTHEPRNTDEVVSAKLVALALVSATGLAVALWRALATWVVTRRLVTDWLRRAEPIRLESLSIPAYRLAHSFPLIAVVGAIRPRLFVAEQIFHSLTREEITAVLAHEQGHVVTRDNFNRGLLRVCGNLLTVLPCGRLLDRAWAETSEIAADEYAARSGASTALDLASALIKIARLVPENERPAIAAGALVTGDDPGTIQFRVHRLTELAAMERIPKPCSGLQMRTIRWAGIGISLLTLAFIATHQDVLTAVHAALENLVSVLQ